MEDRTERIPGTESFVDPAKLDAGEWWAETARVDADGFVPKFQEYGSQDLTGIGRRMESLVAGRANRWMIRTLTDEEAAELGIYFYVEGKIARWHEAIKRGERPSDDTLLDLTVYTMMARMNRAGGLRK